MKRHRPALLSPLGRAIVALITVAVITLCGYAYLALGRSTLPAAHLASEAYNV